MNYPKSVKEIKNLNEFIRKVRGIETDKYWSGILYDCSSANYSDWTRRESRLKWKREMIQKYLDYKNNKLNESDEKDFIHGYCHEWILANYKPGDTIIVLIEFDENINKKALLHTCLFRNNKYIDARGEFNSILEILEDFDYDEFEIVKFVDIEKYKMYINELLKINLNESYRLEEKASIDWNNYLTKEEIKKFLSKDDKVESAEEIIYNTTGNFYNKYFKDFKKSGWTKKKLTQDLANFYYKGHLNEDYVLRGLQNGKSYDLAYNKSRDKLEKFRDEVIGNKITTTWIDEHKIEESKHKIEEKSRNELLAKTKSQTITRYNKAQGYKGFYIYDIDTSTLFNKDSTMLIVCKVGDYHSQVEIENVLYWIEYYAEQNENFQINTKNVTQALMDAIDGWNIKVNCECGDFIYRMAYQATKYGYKYGKPENRPAKIRNPNDLGALCFDGNILVATENGFKPIKDIDIGDYVFTHKGRLRKVIEKSSRVANNVVKAHIGTQDIICTINHPFYSLSDTIEFRPLDMLLTLSRPQVLNCNPVYKSSTSKINLNDAFLLGYYLANGSSIGYRSDNPKYLGSGVRLSINKQYESIYSELLDNMNYSYTFHYNNENNSSYYYIKSNRLRNFCLKYGMYKDDNIFKKYINRDVFYWADDCKIAFLRGFFAGDGQYCSNGKYLNMRFLNTNKSIAEGIHLILRSLNLHSKCVKIKRKPRKICSNSYFSNAKDMYCVTITGKDINTIDNMWLHLVKGDKSGSYLPSNYQATVLENNDIKYFLSGVKQIEFLSDQLVYNIGVEEDESYLVSYDMLAVHNCKHLTSMLSNKKWIQQVTSTLMDFIEKNIVQVNKYLNRKAYEELTLPNTEARNLGKQAAYSKVLDRQEFIQEVANAFIEEAGDKLFDININLNDDLQRFINAEYQYSKITPNEFKVIRATIDNYIKENNESEEKDNAKED